VQDAGHDGTEDYEHHNSDYPEDEACDESAEETKEADRERVGDPHGDWAGRRLLKLLRLLGRLVLNHRWILRPSNVNSGERRLIASEGGRDAGNLGNEGLDTKTQAARLKHRDAGDNRCSQPRNEAHPDGADALT
jgi:hypothetical protein